jgi:hypothetical protein
MKRRRVLIENWEIFGPQRKESITVVMETKRKIWMSLGEDNPISWAMDSKWK